jgi:L-rhamnose mutarotase
MQTIALHTRLQPGRELDYERIHATIPPELDVALRAGGVASWRIWRNGLDLFHVVEVDDYAALQRRLATDPADIAWQARMAELLEVETEREALGPLHEVWHLPGR